MRFENNWQKAKEFFEGALDEDSTYTSAYWNIAWVYDSLGKQDLAVSSAKRALQYSYKYPEPLRLDLRISYYYLIGEPDKAFAVTKMRAQFYPDDVKGLIYLAETYHNIGRWKESIAWYEKVFEIDPGRSDLLTEIAGMYLGLENFAKALEYYRMYAERSHVDFKASFLPRYLITVFLHPFPVNTRSIRHRST